MEDEDVMRNRNQHHQDGLADSQVALLEQKLDTLPHRHSHVRKILKSTLKLTLVASLLSIIVIASAAWSGIVAFQPDDRQAHLDASKGTVLRIGIESFPITVMPNVTTSVWESHLSTQIFEGLVSVNNHLENIPALAKSWEWEGDTLTYTFHLRDGVKFHDFDQFGQTLDCDDVMFSFQTWIHPDYGGVRFANFENILGAREYREGSSDQWPIPGLACLDDLTFAVTMTQPTRTFIPFGAISGIMPKHVYELIVKKRGFRSMYGLDQDLGAIGTGPYMRADPSDDAIYELKRFDDYWQTRNLEQADQAALPGIETVQYVFITDLELQKEALERGELDVVDTRADIDAHLSLRDNPDFSTYVYPQLTYDYWHWNLREERFQDARVRRAMCHAINRQQMIDTVIKEIGQLANGPTHPLRWDWDDLLAELHPTFDPAQTISLMEEAGWIVEKNEDGSIAQDAVWTKIGSDGNEMRMEFEIAYNTSNERRRDFSFFIQQSLSELGFSTEVRSLETNQFYNNYLQGTNDFETAIAGWRVGTDPDSTSIWHTRSIGTAFNWHAYSNSDVDDLLDLARNIIDMDHARPIYQQINRILVETQGYCWLSYQNATFAADPSLKGLEGFNALTPFQHITHWYWENEGEAISVQGVGD
jgi:ABC-type transport system substrate-binding protein